MLPSRNANNRGLAQPFAWSSQFGVAQSGTKSRVARAWYGGYVVGYVVMPEHVHLLISEPERSKLSVTIQMLKQITSQQLRPPG